MREHSPLDVLLITIDTLRADALGAYGNRRSYTPAIDRLATAGARFTDAHAHNVTTLPSHANILSGKYPTEHEVRDNAGFRFPRTLETLATLLKAHGYRTGAFVSAFPLASRFGLSRGFDVYDDSFVDAQVRPAFLEQERRGSETVGRAKRWIDAGGSPYFCWVHIYDPHFPYAPPDPFRSQFRDDPYLGEVAATDAALAPLLDPIVARGRDGQTLVVLTADHGESLGEHDETTHGIFAYEATLRVPLIVFAPRLATPHVVSEPARHVDVLPTILEALSIREPDGLPGRSLLPVVQSSSAESRRSDSDDTIYFEALSGNLNRGWAPLHGLLRHRLKYIDLPSRTKQPFEIAVNGPRTFLGEHGWPTVDAMGASRTLWDYRDFIQRSKAEFGVSESPETRERLRSLGYIGTAAGASKTRYTQADDPKRLIQLDVLLQDVARSYFAGDLRGALARCRELVQRRPTMVVSLLELAHLERESGNMTQAIDALRQALAVNPEDTQTVALLTAYLTQAGRPREAVDVCAPYIARDQADLQLLVSGALALAAAGRYTEAVAAMTKARTDDPGNAMLLVETGTIFVMAGDRGRARHEFDAALALNPTIARAHSSLAIMAAERGSHAEALAHWKQAISLDPKELGNLLTFGEFLARRGPPSDARPYLELYLRSASSDHDADIEKVRRWLAQSPPEKGNHEDSKARRR